MYFIELEGKRIHTGRAMRDTSRLIAVTEIKMIGRIIPTMFTYASARVSTRP
jgi:hypothetical protein